ncbi:hypothetical protein HPB47_022260 [Ixodes persulcatus]|uniref:Uncharacterized protein n=1 Tax=Ixodes persulcatus TaxID=34615 RepID=A0AC60QDK3_IXOPE|nr:hypothetical protein HPB47_022260 [Ixodes persulcatus]
MDLTLAPLCLLLLATAAEGSFGTTLTAVFNSGGLRGLVEFSPSPSGPVVNVRASLVGGQSKETFRWGIHRLPPRHDSSAPCDPIWTGDMLQDLTLRLGGLASEQEMRFLAPGLELFSGRDPLVGRALVLKSVQTGRSACATLLSSLSSRTYVAYFAGPVAGTVFVRQWASYASVYGELYWINGTRRDYRVQWSLLHGGAVRPSGRQVQQSLESTGVPVNVPTETPDVLVPFYVPPGEAAQLSSPHAPTTRTYHVFSDLMSLEAVAMGNLQVALRDAAGTLISVVGLHLWRPKHAVANLGQNNGKVKPFETPPAGWGTSDQYAVGDLTGKYGLFSGKADVYRQLLDPTLPMSGPESVVGRMLVACGRNGVPLVCANILPVGRRLIRGRATFDGIVRGDGFEDVSGMQVEDDPLDDVYVDIGVCWTGPNNGSVDHNWHVHSKALAPGSADCISAGGHYDPHKVAHNPVYECECSARAPWRCEAGDLSSRMATVSFPSCSETMARYHFSGSNLALSGPTSVIGLPIVIHDAHYTGPRVACANIQRV